MSHPPWRGGPHAGLKVKGWFCMLKFQRFDPGACAFPRPRVPVLPQLRWSDLSARQQDTLAPQLVRGAGVWHFARGRYALHAAYSAAGIGPAGVLLAPAYHCRTMLDPALALGGTIRFYPLDAELTPSLASIEALVIANVPAARVLLVPHYFGVAQPAALMQALLALCRRHDIMLIEDCSHAWQVAEQRVAACQSAPGHVVVASPYKYFACPDGGVLWGHPATLATHRQSGPGLMAEARTLCAMVGATGTRAVPLPPLAPLPAPAPLVCARDRAESGDRPSPQYQREQEGRSSLTLTRLVMQRTRLTPLARQRRANYFRWSEAVAGLREGKALFAALPADCAPYMFALRITQPDQQFYQLKQAGVPIWRWDDMAVSDCPVAADYRLHLLHLPCHQSLTPSQMEWMTAAVAQVLA